MSAAPQVIRPQNVAKIARCWKVMPLVSKDSGKVSPCTRLISGDASSSGEDCNTKVRKPYTITKQRERWTETEHQKFLEALKLYGRAWRRIEEYIGTKTAVQIRSHAQKFFSKLEREASTGSSAGKAPDIEIPPPRPKRKPSHPYPKKAGNSPLNLDDENKESSALSSPGLAAGHQEGFQSGTFTHCTSKGLGSGLAVSHRNPLVSGHFFGPEGHVKLFGKTVVVPKNHKPASQNDSGKECLGNGELQHSSAQTYIQADVQQSVGLPPFQKVRKEIENFSEEPSQSDRDGSCLVTNISEGAGELYARNCSDGLADSHILCEEEEQQEGASRVEVKKVENKTSPPQEGGVNFPHLANPNNYLQLWIDSFFHYQSGLSLTGHGLPDGPPTNPLTYWQFMRASAVNYAAYTAAMAAAAAAGWTGYEESTEASRANVTEAQFSPSLGIDLHPAAIPSAATAWWPLRGFMPSGYTPPIGTMHQREQGIDSACNAHHPLEYSNEDASPEHISSQGEHTMDSETEDAVVTSEPLGLQEDEKKHTENILSAKIGCMLGTSCVAEEPTSENAFPDLEIQHEGDATSMRLKFCTQTSDSQRRIVIESPQSPYSSSEEFDGQIKKQGDGSSSGSNSPVSWCKSSECEALTMSKSKKRNSHTLFDCSGAFKKYHQLCSVNTTESLKVRAKHSEEGRKQQQVDSRHGGGDDSKRLKSCAHETEIRKEVSQEGRKAFRALFTSKLLPQTFAATNVAEEMYTCLKNERVSRPTVSKKETVFINVSMPMEEAGGECINLDGSPQDEAIIGEVHIHNNVSRTTSAILEMGFRRHEEYTKSFTVSSSSGFVPYRRLNQPSSF